MTRILELVANVDARTLVPYRWQTDREEAEDGPHGEEGNREKGDMAEEEDEGDAARGWRRWGKGRA